MEIEIESGCGASFRLFRQILENLLCENLVDFAVTGDRVATTGSRLFPVLPRGSVFSRDFEFLLFPDSRDALVAEEFEEIAEMLFEVVQILALGPMVRVVIQVAEILAIGLAPVGDLRFHGG